MRNYNKYVNYTVAKRGIKMSTAASEAQCSQSETAGSVYGLDLAPLPGDAMRHTVVSVKPVLGQILHSHALALGERVQDGNLDADALGKRIRSADLIAGRTQDGPTGGALVGVADPVIIVLFGNILSILRNPSRDLLKTLATDGFHQVLPKQGVYKDTAVKI